MNKSGMDSDRLSTAGQSKQMRIFILHRNLSIFCLLLLFLLNWLIDGSGWFFWLALSWIMVLVIHFCIVKSIDVDEDWADERARDLRIKSYDYKHIYAIRGSYIKPRSAKNQGNKNQGNKNPTAE